MHKPPVVITGMGAVSACGCGIEATLGAFRTGRRNVRRVSLFETSLDVPVYEVEDPDEGFGSDGMRTIQLAIRAAEEATASADLDRRQLRHLRVGVALGTTVACQLNDIDFYRTYRRDGRPSMRPVDRFLKGNLAEAVGTWLGAGGPFLTVANACSSGTDAIGVALSWLANNICDVVLAGGADELNRVPLCGFHALGVVSRAPCKPFDRHRDGLNLGEGAGILILENAARARMPRGTCELGILGYGSAADAHHLTAPRPDGTGLEGALHQALSHAGVRPEDIGFVNAHGTATPSNDKVEGEVLARVFGPAIRVVSTKGFTGHTLGAAGGLEAVFTAVALRDGWIPMTAGFTDADPDIPLVPVCARTAVDRPLAVSTSLAFGGSNAALVMTRRG